MTSSDIQRSSENAQTAVAPAASADANPRPSKIPPAAMTWIGLPVKGLCIVSSIQVNSQSKKEPANSRCGLELRRRKQGRELMKRCPLSQSRQCRGSKEAREISPV